MKHYLFPLIAMICSIFMTSCGIDNNPLLGMDDVETSDLTTPLFLSYDNTLDKSEKKIWAFNNTEVVKGTITVVGDDVLRVKADWFFNSWSLSGKKLTLSSEDMNKTYDLRQVSLLSYNAIAFGTTYVCIPSTNKSLDGVRYEDDWHTRGLTKNAFWEAFRQSYAEGTSVDITLTK